MRINFSKILKFTIITVSILIKIAILLLFIFGITSIASFLAYWIINAITIIFMLYVVYKKDSNSFKLSWVVFIVIIPPLAMFTYLATTGKFYVGRKHKEKGRMLNKIKENLEQDKEILEEMKMKCVASHIKLMNNLSPFVAYKNTSVEYLDIGEKAFEVMIEEIRKAKRFIYLEYFIVSKGEMLDRLMDELIKKRNEGVEVKFLYDATCKAAKIFPKDWPDLCEKHGIKCKAFNPFTMSVYRYVSYRDHRKMTLIDGNVCISGGLNIADEYINKIDRFGHWRDTAVIFKGEGVYTFTNLFVTMWNFVSNENLAINDKKPTIKVKGEPGSFVMPYGDGPDNEKNPAINLYLSMINTANDYVYIVTPYLILDDELTAALILGAKRGVDIRISTPGIPDKKFINNVTKAHYEKLAEVGVRIFEYTPGFVHSKTIVCDDKTFVVGSINFDFRSLMWNFETGVWVYNSKAALDIKNDFLDIVSKSTEINYADIERKSFVSKVVYSILRTISPLL